MILIYCSEDGDHYIHQISKEKFLKDLNAGEYGENPKFFDETTIRSSSDLNCVAGYIIIEGDIVVPKAEKIVTKFKL